MRTKKTTKKTTTTQETDFNTELVSLMKKYGYSDYVLCADSGKDKPVSFAYNGKATNCIGLATVLVKELNNKTNFSFPKLGF